jgi:hypothetical protein
MRLRAFDYEIEFTLDEVHQIVQTIDQVFSLPKQALCTCGHNDYMHADMSLLKGELPKGECRYDSCSCKEFRDISGP